MSENGELLTIELPGSITVRELAGQLKASPIDIIKILMANGVMANINQQIDFDTAAVVAAELGYEAALLSFDAAINEDTSEIPLWKRLIAKEDQDQLVNRPPVVTILGHVDHGKTTLLDTIRQAHVVEGEAGGITQHIGAYQVQHAQRSISFLDTPGHAAFTAMRARGAQGADIVVLVVAADDGVMPQTKEAIAHAKAARVPIIVALNKMDKNNADPDRAKQQLAEAGLVPDEWDGETIIVPMSATEREGLDDLLEAILLVADNTEILANPQGSVFGTVIEARRERGRGIVATLLIQNGTLEVGNIVVTGKAYGRLRAMFDHRARRIRKAGPSTPVYVMGLNEVPDAGDLFRVVNTEREARIIIKKRVLIEEQKKQAQKRTMTLEQLFERVKSGEARELRLIIKADVQGSLEPIISSLEALDVGEISVNILHGGTGAIGENDVMLAIASQAVIVGFNVQADAATQRLADAEGVSIRSYNIIYRITEDIEKALKGLLEPEERITVVGRATVQAVFPASKLGRVAGCRVIEGELRRNGRMRVIRREEKIFEGEVTSLKRHQEDVREVRQGFECGVGLKGFNEFAERDILECFITEMVAVI
ncbi:MAG: translation initiation factor IF-2 [Chloroflexota bacterium]